MLILAAILGEVGDWERAKLLLHVATSKCSPVERFLLHDIPYSDIGSVTHENAPLAIAHSLPSKVRLPTLRNCMSCRDDLSFTHFDSGEESTANGKSSLWSTILGC